MNQAPRGPSPAGLARPSLARMGLAIGLLTLAVTVEAARPTGQAGVDWGDPRGDECVDCHMTENPGLYWEWNHSAHGQAGVNCLDCHQREEGAVDAFKHEGEFISIVVTPKNCSTCHETEFQEMDGSHHAKAGQILGSLDNLLGEVIGGPAAVNAGCKQCHGGELEFYTEGKNKGRPTPGTWPNTGIGRINPDGSLGSCTACHGRHRFSRAQARTPDTCGKCHVGP
ncbi:multiheme c-type cytochrome, partial [Thiocapsa sp.]|uniref:multiheme c-type cytochrome n=1 Tax=Thiocapsa sp. TaxID=2024551 RepID=UPI003593F694